MAAVLGRKLDYDVRVQEAWDYVPWTIGKDSTPTGQCQSWTTLSDTNFCETLKELPGKVGAQLACMERTRHHQNDPSRYVALLNCFAPASSAIV